LEFSQDFEDLLGAFIEQNVDFVIVGAHALAAHGHSRATGDLDVLVRPTADNARLVHRALQAFGAPLLAHGVRAEDFEREDMVYQMGLPPQRIDILTSVSGVSYDDCTVDALSGLLGKVVVRFMGLEAQIKNKRATGRTKDLADVEALEALRARRPRS
jgi:hypothetical protein